ncbi:hypothetical protein [Catenovulum agarivorans]|uniref:hypothetical protein n=1 Tax=Catenovulum agarivorans TaxID=1172192 RepID=UPI000308C8CE|nr:hypothetical protein [Catenovulum agarivorans]
MKSLFKANAEELRNQYGRGLLGQKLEVRAIGNNQIGYEVGTVYQVVYAKEIDWCLVVRLDNDDAVLVGKDQDCGIVDIAELYNCGVAR